MNKDNIFKFIFSGTFIGLAMLMIFSDWFKSRIDVTIISLFVIAFLPWLVRYVKSFEGFGIKTELVTEEKKEKIEKVMEQLSSSTSQEDNVVNKNIVIDKTKPIGSEENPLLIESIDSIAKTINPIEKMVLIRYEIEKELKILCRINNLHTSQRTIRQMIQDLRENKILDNVVSNLLLDILPILNKAVHADIDNTDFADLEWIIEKGSALVMHLEIISKDPSKYWMVSFD